MNNELKTKAELALEIARAMAELRNCLRNFKQAKIREHGINLTYEMLEILAELWKKDGINQQELADLTVRDKSSMTYLIDNLVKRKYVKRLEDETDRRNKLIFLTDEGKALKEQLLPWFAEVYEMSATDVDVIKLEEGVSLLNKMISNLKPQ